MADNRCKDGDRAVFSVVKNTPLPAFENALYAYRVKLGLEPYIEGTV